MRQMIHASFIPQSFSTLYLGGWLCILLYVAYYQKVHWCSKGSFMIGDDIFTDWWIHNLSYTDWWMAISLMCVTRCMFVRVHAWVDMWAMIVCPSSS